MSYAIFQKFISHNRSRTALKPVGIALHETDTAGATAENEYSYFNTAERNASAHAFVDWSEIIQTIPWLEKGWHACEPANSLFIGVELCHATNQAQFNAVWDRAVWLFAYLFINVIHVHTVTRDNLMSHAEISAKWHNTDHTDPVSYFKQYGKTVDQFRASVQSEISIILRPAATPKPIAPAKPKEVFDMKKIVVYVGDADLFAAILVSQKLGCPLMRKVDFVASGLKVQQVITIGGKPGSTRFTSFKDAAALV